MVIAMIVATVCVAAVIPSGASGTGVGLAEWALNAYYSGWRYVYGGASAGAVDCSGLIYSYAGGYRVGDAQTFNSSYRGNVSGGIPNIHGLGLYKPGHVGVYVGGGMAVDARGDEYGICYESAYSHGWTLYFKVPGVSYPSTGWQTFNGSKYYYENGEYLADTTRTIDGVSYSFNADGTVSGSAKSSSGSSKSSGSSSTSSASSDDGVLRNGSSGDKVVALQTRLAELGYYDGAIDGDFGDMTEKAFKLFQKQMGLYVDGIAGSDVEYLYADDAPAYTAEKSSTSRKDKDDLADTGAKADDDADKDADEKEEDAEEPSVYTFSLGDESEKLVAIQQRLISLGYLDDEADGVFGQNTYAAVTEFQSANGLDATGVIDETTYQMIFSNTVVKLVAEKENEASRAPVETTTAVTATTAPHTAAAVQSNELSNKAMSNITDSIGFKQGANATNFQFIMWLMIMIVVMLISFGIVYAVEKKKARAASVHRYQ